MRIALATCRDLPDWEVDDEPLHRAFEARGVELQRPAWDGDSFDWRSVDACLIRTTWDYMERRDEYVAWARRVETLTRLFNPAAVVAWNTHKSYLRDLAEAGVPTLPTHWLAAGSSVDVRELMESSGWTRGFLKPAVGATARETLRFDATTEGLARADAHLMRVLPNEDLLLQPYQESVERSGEISLFVIDGQVTHAVRKVPVAGDYRVQDDFGAHDEPMEPTPDDVELARRVVAAVPHDLLYARADFLRDSAGSLRLIELELVEPSLFFRHGPDAAARLADALLRRIHESGVDASEPPPTPSLLESP